MKSKILTLGAMGLIAASLVLAGCNKHEGVAETAGKKIDHAASAVKDAVTPDGPAEKAGKKIDDTVSGDN